MAKKTATAKPAAANKSTAIREILAAKPKANVKEVQAELQKRGIKASDALVNKIKYSKGRAGGKNAAAAGATEHRIARRKRFASRSPGWEHRRAFATLSPI